MHQGSQMIQVRNYSLPFPTQFLGSSRPCAIYGPTPDVLDHSFLPSISLPVTDIEDSIGSRRTSIRRSRSTRCGAPQTRPTRYRTLLPSYHCQLPTTTFVLEYQYGAVILVGLIHTEVHTAGTCSYSCK